MIIFLPKNERFAQKTTEQIPNLDLRIGLYDKLPVSFCSVSRSMLLPHGSPAPAFFPAWSSSSGLFLVYKSSLIGYNIQDVQ